MLLLLRIHIRNYIHLREIFLSIVKTRQVYQYRKLGENNILSQIYAYGELNRITCIESGSKLEVKKRETEQLDHSVLSLFSYMNDL